MSSKNHHESDIIRQKHRADSLNGYTAEHPGLVVILIDQSASMNMAWEENGEDTRADKAAIAVNSVCAEITSKCRTMSYIGSDASAAWERKVYLLVLGYHTDREGNPKINEIVRGWPDHFGPLWPRPTSDNSTLPLKWESSGDTPMAEAIDGVHQMIKELIGIEPLLGSGFPPCVLHITDAEANDFKKSDSYYTGDGKATRDAAAALCSYDVNGSRVAFLNILIRQDEVGTVLFPDQPVVGEWGNFLWDISSYIPAFIARKIETLNNKPGGPKVQISPESKGLVITDNAGILVQFLRWGTVVS